MLSDDDRGHWEMEGSVLLRSVREAEDGWLEVDLEAGEKDGSACFSMDVGSVEDPFWCIPGIFWGDNLQDSTPHLYPRFDRSAEEPHHFRSRRWLIPLNRMAQPLVGVYGKGKWHVLEVEPNPRTSGEGEISISVGFEWSAEKTILMLRVPESEEPYTHSGCELTEATLSSWKNKPRHVTVRYRFFEQVGERIDLLGHLRERYLVLSSSAAGRLVSAEPEEVAAAAAHGLTRWHYSKENETFKYTVAYDRVGQQIAEAAGCSLDSVQFFVGWVNGWVVLEPLLDYAKRAGDERAFEMACKAWQRVCAGIVSPSGFWWSRHAPEFVARSGEPKTMAFRARLDGDFDGGWMADPNHLHLRTIGDGVLRAVRSLDKHGANLPFADELREQILRQAELVAGLVGPDGSIPLAVDARTGAPTSLAGSAGMIWISVWLELQRQGLWTNTEVIKRAALFVREAVHTGLLYGAPEDVGECMSSEDVYIAVNAFCDRYEHTGAAEDLETACVAASWLLTYRRAFHVPLPPRTLLAMHGLSSIGGDLASGKNNHLHIYGLDAEKSLGKISQWTGDKIWEQMAEDHWKFAVQTVCLEDGHFNGYRGLVPEQPYFINWACLNNSVHRQEDDVTRNVWVVDEGYVNRGNMAGFSNVWCVAFVLAAALRRMKPDNHASAGEQSQPPFLPGSP